MVGRVAPLMLLAAAVVVTFTTARTPDRDWATFYGDRWNVSLDHETRPRPGLKSLQTGSRRGDMSPQEASWAVQPIEVDTSYHRQQGHDIPDGASAPQPPRPQPPRRTPQRPPPAVQPPRPQQPRRTPQRPPPPVQPVVIMQPVVSGRLPLPIRTQADDPSRPRIFINPGSRMTADERAAILVKYKTVLQLAEALNKDIIEAKRRPLCGASGPTTTLDSLQSSVGVVQAALEILIRVIRDSFTEVSLATNIYQNLEVVYELLVSVKITTETIKSQIVVTNDKGDLTVYCPTGYQVVGGQCFYMHTSSTATWFHARTQCKRQGGDLAVPHNLQLLQSHILSQRPDERSLEFWLGGNDLTNEHGWNWITGEQMNMNNGWNPGEPNNARGGEDCVMLLDKDYPPLNDARCEKDHLNYICEAPSSDKIQQNPTEDPGTPGELNKSECGDEKVQSGTKCFYVSSSTEYVPWFKARQACKDMGGSLAPSHTQEVVDYIMNRCGEKRWYWMGPSDLDNIQGADEQHVNLLTKTCHVFDAGQDGQPQLPLAACEGEWHYICQRPC